MDSDHLRRYRDGPLFEMPTSLPALRLLEIRISRQDAARVEGCMREYRLVVPQADIVI